MSLHDHGTLYIGARKWSAREEVEEVDRNQQEQGRGDHAARSNGAVPLGQGNCGTLMCFPIYRGGVER
jgi:hypothetical protein